MTADRTTMSAADFAAKWRESARRERASSQEHFIDLCRMLGVPTPNDPPASPDYTFEAGAERLSTGRQGWADVWKRGHFGWEYKGRHADLAAAYRQLLDYREDLENPPALVVSDMDRIEVHTNFTGTRPAIETVTLDDLAEGGERTAEALRALRAVMLDPEALRPEQTPDEITQLAAARFAEIARSMHERGHDPEAVAHHLNRVVFCLFAEDARLLPERVLTDMIESRRGDPEAFDRGLADLFLRMSDRDADRFYGNVRVEWFNGGLFDDAEVIPCTRQELRAMHDAALLDWSRVEPAILGTLFERGLDPEKRGQLGAHYTDHEKIMMVVEPVVLDPLRREFAAMQARVEELAEGHELSAPTRDGRRRARAALQAWERDAEDEWRAFLERLRAVRVLDPACGSGNFLYVTLRRLKDLEQEAIRWGAERLRIPGEFPRVDPGNVLGIEINPYAKELAGVSIWIGHIQWMIDHGYGSPTDPVLQPLDNIELRDAILARDAEGAPVPATWPEAEFVVGNPPFLGAKRMRLSLGDEYVNDLFTAWEGEMDRDSDLVCYWHELARRRIATDAGHRAGLLATNSVRGGANRITLERIDGSGGIFMAWSDEPWIVDGAAVRVSIVGQDDGSETARALDGEPVDVINSNLTTGPDLTSARVLPENTGVSFMGDTKGGAFEIAGEAARNMLTQPSNINGRPNADVVVPWVNGMDITRRPRGMFIIDFGTDTPESDAASYESPFEYIAEHVRPNRAKSRTTQKSWWLHERPRPAMRAALATLGRYIATSMVAKHRTFVWLPPSTNPHNVVIVIARDDDYAFGVLHSRAHELWSLRMGTWLGVGNDPRYTPTSTFETFPFPWPLDTPDEALSDEQRAHRDAIAEAARALDEARRRWLNPPELVREEPDVVPSLPPRLLPVDEDAERVLKRRTLTNLYNERPRWLSDLHATLDAAVYASYGWGEGVGELGEEELLGRLLALNLERAG